MVTESEEVREYGVETRTRLTHTFGLQLAKVRDMMGVTGRAMEILTSEEGFAGHPSSKQSNWVNRSDRGISLAAVAKISDRFALNYTWMLTGKGDMFSPEWMEFRVSLMALIHELHDVTPAQRLSTAWNMISQSGLLEEDAWAAWLRCYTLDNPTYQPTPNLGRWFGIKHGEVQPTDVQLQNAAMLTGLPLSWLSFGEVETPSV